MIWFIVDAGVLMLLIKLIGGEDVQFWLALCMGALASLTIFGVGEMVLEYGLAAFFGLVAAIGVVLSLLVWILGEVKPIRSFLIGGAFIVYKFGLALLFALGN
jgi:hypothetical protein